MKIAIVYDWIATWGGAERVLVTLQEMYPGADWYTAYYDKKLAPWADSFKIQTSFIQKLPFHQHKHRFLLSPLMPFAFESFNLNAYDLVISCTSYFAKSVITRPETRHICYLLTPTRGLWEKSLPFYLRYAKTWDYVAAQRPDQYVAISETVQKRIKEFYKRDSEVIYPSFDVDYWEKIKKQIAPSSHRPKPYYLLVSRLEPYKKTELAIQAFNQNGKSLVVVGSGSQEDKLRAMASGNITLLRQISDEKLAGLYLEAEALVVPQEEDFGYAPLEAQFFGCPTIAYRSGGATETIIDNETGIFFNEQTPDSLQKALEKFEPIAYTLRHLTQEKGPKNILKFAKERFKKQFANL